MCVLPRLSKCIVYLAFEMLRALCHTQMYTDTYHAHTFTNNWLFSISLARSLTSFVFIWLACMSELYACVYAFFGICAFLFSFVSSCVIVVVYPISLYSTACCLPVARDSKQPNDGTSTNGWFVHCIPAANVFSVDRFSMSANFYNVGGL